MPSKITEVRKHGSLLCGPLCSGLLVPWILADLVVLNSALFYLFCFIAQPCETACPTHPAAALSLSSGPSDEPAHTSGRKAAGVSLIPFPPGAPPLTRSWQPWLFSSTFRAGFLSDTVFMVLAGRNVLAPASATARSESHGVFLRRSACLEPGMASCTCLGERVGPRESPEVP